MSYHLKTDNRLSTDKKIDSNLNNTHALNFPSFLLS